MNDRELRETADEILRNGIFKGDHAVAARLFEQHRDVATLDIYIACAAGELAEVRRVLTADSDLAARVGGPLGWPPLLYLAYQRLPGGARHAVEIARELLDRSADPNALWREEWGSRFTVVAGVIGLGEGVKPTHERADELVDLLVERGADPVDHQSFYDTSIVSDDTHWLDVLWRHSERRGVTERWSTERVGEKQIAHFELMLSIAVSYGHCRRAEWLLEHGADPNAPHAYSGRPLREEALVHGNAAMVELLARKGASPAELSPQARFQIACRTLDREGARRLAAAHPELLQAAEPLIAAARANRAELVEMLLELGTPVDVADQGGIRALNVAAGNGALETMKLLIARGADIDRPTLHYGGPLGFAAHFGQRGAAELLAPLTRDVHNLVFLAMKDRLRELFAREPELVNRLHPRAGTTPLFALSSDDSAAAVMSRFLLEHGADASIRNRAGDTPASAARKRGLETAAALLATR